MLIKNKTITVSGSGVIKLPDGIEKIVASYNGSINQDDSFNINKYVADNALYNENYAMCKVDYNEFEDYARAFLTSVTTDELTSESTSESISESESQSELYSESEAITE